MIKQFFFLLFLLVAASSHAQIVNIPDANFKDACVNAPIVDFDGDGTPEADVDTNDDGEIQVSEALAVQRMYPRGSGIQSLVGIEAFSNLQILNCSMNVIDELDFSQNLELTVLSCFFNNLTSLNVSQNLNLMELNCDLNNLTTLDVTGCPLLERLTCPENELSNLDLTQNTALKTFTGDLNQLTNLDFTQCPGLEFASFDNNQISSIDFTQNPNLSVVDVFNNNLTVLDFTQNTVLTKLWCYNNNLQSLNIKNGNNAAITLMRAQGNADLECVQVDDAIFAENQSSWEIDLLATYSENCALSINDFSSQDVTIYPIPARSDLYLSISEAHQISEIELITVNGLTALTPNPIGGKIDVSTLASGVYFLRIVSTNGTVVKKIAKE